VVGLAQEDYIKSLLDVDVLSDRDFPALYDEDFQVPSPILKVSGTRVILRDADQMLLMRPISMPALSTKKC
jgi:hypothetical protein